MKLAGIYKTVLVIIFVVLFAGISSGSKIFAEDPTPTPTTTSSAAEERRKAKEEEIRALEAKLNAVRSQSQTLSSQITVMNNQIKLTQLRIDSVQEQILDLNADIDTATKKVSSLEESLSRITKVLLNRIRATYQVGTVNPLEVFMSSKTASDYFTKENYLKVIQEHDKKLIYETQQARNDYANQKDIFEEKKKKIEALEQELKGYTTKLDAEKKAKESLLTVTRNDEKRYQDLLARSRDEYLAIQGIVAGNGQETEAGVVKEGQRIASIIQGASCNSSGAHLHFIVSRGGSTESPFNYLKSVSAKNCSGSSCGSGDGDSFNPSGSWNWPIEPEITLNQGYGVTWAVRYYLYSVYSFHNGVDINSASADVKAVQDGTLYQGSYVGKGGCRLPYVRVRHNDGLDTFYLHINYVF